MVRVHRLLGQEDPSIAQIAAQVGYESEASFTPAFKRVLGTPPAAWRRQRGSA